MCNITMCISLPCKIYKFVHVRVMRGGSMVSKGAEVNGQYINYTIVICGISFFKCYLWKMLGWYLL